MDSSLNTPVVTVTFNPAVDENTEVERVEPDKKLRCTTPRYHPGGGGINIARALHVLGTPAVAVYPCGGHSGNLLRDLLAKEGVRQRPVPVRRAVRINFIVYERSSGEQYRFGFPGQRLSPEECGRIMSELERLIPETLYVVASGSLPPGVPPDHYATVVRMAHRHGARAVVDTSGEPLKLVAREPVFLLKTNLNEFSYLVGEPLDDPSRLAEKAGEMVESGCIEHLVVSLGPRGAVAAWKGRVVSVPSPDVPVRSRLGAGDSMVAGMVHALVRGLSMEEALAWGVAAGASAAMTDGSMICCGPETAQLYEKVAASMRA